MIQGSPRFRFKPDDEDPVTAPCSDCRARMSVTGGRANGKLQAYSEGRDAYGRKVYLCRRCTEKRYFPD